MLQWKEGRQEEDLKEKLVDILKGKIVEELCMFIKIDENRLKDGC